MLISDIVPIPTYFTLGKYPLPESLQAKVSETGGEVVNNLVFLGEEGVMSERMAYSRRNRKICCPHHGTGPQDRMCRRSIRSRIVRLRGGYSKLISITACISTDSDTGTIFTHYQQTSGRRCPLALAVQSVDIHCGAISSIGKTGQRSSALGFPRCRSTVILVTSAIAIPALPVSRLFRFLPSRQCPTVRRSRQEDET
jgi:hypothetical protein